jgi:hypothetical protein
MHHIQHIKFDSNYNLENQVSGIQLADVVLSTDMKPLFINYTDVKKYFYKHSDFQGQHREQTVVPPKAAIHHKKGLINKAHMSMYCHRYIRLGENKHKDFQRLTKTTVEI